VVPHASVETPEYTAVRLPNATTPREILAMGDHFASEGDEEFLLGHDVCPCRKT
jgi:hypothetical protein